MTFLTICPWPRLPLAAPQDMARSMFWFPWIGAVLGLTYWAAFQVFVKILSDMAAAALLVALTAVATRGLHLDGLADTLDGLGGGGTPEGRLAIMKDSRLGTFGAVGLILILLLKFAFFLGIAAQGKHAAFMVFPVLSRWGMVFLASLSPYARPEGGLGQAMTQGISSSILAGATLSAMVFSFIMFGFRGLALMAGLGVIVALLSPYFRRRLGGITGDVLGAVNELGEILVLAGVLVL